MWFGVSCAGSAHFAHIMLPVSTTEVDSAIATATSAAIVERWHGTQEQLADHLDMAPPALRDRLRGRTRWSASDLHHLSALLRVPVQDLYAPPVDLFSGPATPGTD